MHLTLNSIFQYGSAVVTICSILHSFLPPWDFLNDFPRAQKYYKLLIYIIGYIALNARSTTWHLLSVNNPSGPNANPTNGGSKPTGGNNG